MLCKSEQLHHTDTEFFGLLRYVKGDKGQALQNQHELAPLEKSLNYFKAIFQKETPEFSVKEKSKHLKRPRHREP